MVIKSSMGVESVTSTKEQVTSKETNRFDSTIDIDTTVVHENNIDCNNDKILREDHSIKNEMELSPRRDEESNSIIDIHDDENNGNGNASLISNSTNHNLVMQECHHDDGNDNDSNHNDDNDIDSKYNANAVEMILEDNDTKEELGIRLPQDPAIHISNDDIDGPSDDWNVDAEIRTAPSGVTATSDNANDHDNDNADVLVLKSLPSRDISFDESESFDGQGAKDLILAVTNEEEQEDLDAHDYDTIDDTQSQQLPHRDPSIIDNGNRVPVSSSYASPLRVSTGFNHVSADHPSALMKSPTRCESPGMKKRKEELNKSEQSIRRLEEQLNIVSKEQQQHNSILPSKSQSQQPHAPLDHDNVESMASTLTSTCSLLLQNSSRTLLTGSSTIINADSELDSCPQRQQTSPIQGKSPRMRRAFAGQRESSQPLGSPSRQSSKDGRDGAVTPTPVINSEFLGSVTTPKASNNNFDNGKDSIDSYTSKVDAKLAEQRRAHEDQIDEILDQLNSIENTYGKEIASLKDRLSKKEIMEEGLLSSLTSYQLKNAEIKQKYEQTLTNLDEAKQEFEAEHERYAALMREMEHDKMMFVNAAREEVRSAAELQFASAQKTFVKLKQDYKQCLEERDTLEQQCGDMIEKFDCLEVKERSQEAMISNLMVQGADSEAKMATEKAAALKIKQEYTEKAHAMNKKANRENAEAYALVDQAIKEKEALKKENSELQSLCEELMAIVEGRVK